MLPNEIIDKIFQYRYLNFKKFLFKIRRVNKEYKNLFTIQNYSNYSNNISREILELADNNFKYNYRDIKKYNYSKLFIHNPKKLVDQPYTINLNGINYLMTTFARVAKLPIKY